MTESPRCPKCGIQLPADAPAGLCPKCLVQAGFESQSLSASAEAGLTKLTPPASGFVPPTVEELAPLFPQLEILELLGKGGMGAVYKARQPGLDRLVAIKILPPEISRDPAFAERFQREARALARLSHPHIVAVYDFGQVCRAGARSDPIHRVSDHAQPDDRMNAVTTSANGLCYIVMEFVDGANLRQAIQTKKLTPAEALAIVPQICEALQFAHDEGIVHRDIKPENILIDKRGRVKIADFGLAKLLGTDASDHSLTGTHQVMGTLRYMAPEQMQGSREVDHRADIYSLGVVFYELLTGELPMGKFAPPSKKVQVDVRLDEVVLRALEQDPEQRYQHASDVKSEIDTISRTPLPAIAARPESSKGVESRNVVPATPFDDSGRATQPWSKVEITTAAAVAVAFALAAVKGIFEISQRPSPLDNFAMFATAVATVAVAVLLVLRQLGRTNGSRAAMPGFCIAVLAACAGSLPWTAVFSPVAGWLFWQGAVFAALNFLLSLGLLIAGDARPRMRAIGLLLAGLVSFGLVIAFDIGPVGVIGSNFLGTITSKPGLPGEFIAAALSLLAMIAGALQLRQSDENAGTSPDSTPTGMPLTQMRFMVADSTNVAQQAVFHFSSLGYELSEQRTDVCVFRRGGQWAGLWETDIRKIATRLTVRTAPAADGQRWVSCDWSVRTMGAWITRRDIRQLEAEGHGFQSLLGVAQSQDSPSVGPQSQPRFSRFAIAGAVWALFGLLAIVPILFFIGLNRVWNGTALPTDVIYAEPPLVFTIFMGALLAIGAGAPIGTTIFGALSIGHIRRSGGKIIGLPLAVTDAIFFPLLVVFAGIVVPFTLALCSVLPLQLIAAAAVLIAGVAASICFLIARAAWRTLGPRPSVDHHGSAAVIDSKSEAVLTEPRLSRCALIGAIWAPLIFIAAAGSMVAVAVPAGEHRGPAWWQLALAFTLLPLGVLAPFGTTILGAVGIAKIKRSEGKLYGLRLAAADALLFPLLALGGITAVLTHFTCIAVWTHWPARVATVSSSGDSPPRGFPGESFMILDAIAAIVVCFFVGRVAWRAITRQDKPVDLPSPTSSGEKSGEPGGVSPRTSGEQVRGLTPSGSPALRVAPRPKLVPVLAMFNLIGAIVLMLVCATEPIPAAVPSGSNLWQVWEVVDSVLGFTMAAGMFAASIGLFLWKPWARKLTLGVCVFGLASFVFDAPYLARFAIPDLYAEIQQTITEQGIEPDARDFVATFTVVVLTGGTMVVVLTWLIGQLVYFTRPRVAAAFASSNEKPSRFVEWLFTGAGAVVGVLSVFGPLALLLGIASLMQRYDTSTRPLELPPPPSFGTITGGIGAEFRVPIGQVAVLEIVTRRDGQTVPVPPHCGYVIAPSDRRLAATFRWLKAAEQPASSDNFERWNLEIKTAGGGGGFSGGLMLPKDLGRLVGSMGIQMSDLAPNEEVIHWFGDANDLPENGLLGLRVTVTPHGLETAGGSGNAHIDWKKAVTNTSTSRRKLLAEEADSVHRAAELGDVVRVKQLFDGGASVNAKDSDGQTPLMKAVANGHRSLAITLVILGADLTEQDSHGTSALMIAAERRDVAFLSRLNQLYSLSYERDAAERKKSLLAFPGVERVLIEGRDIDRQGIGLYDAELLKDEKGENALMKAARAGDWECLKLLSHQVDSLLARDKLGRTVLMHAVLSGKAHESEWLANDGWLTKSPLFGIAGQDNIYVGLLLIFELERSLSVLDNDNKSVVQLADSHGHAAVARTLRRHLEAIITNQAAEIAKGGNDVAKYHRLCGLAWQALGEQANAEAEFKKAVME